jgi:HNH endonuclease
MVLKLLKRLSSRSASTSGEAEILAQQKPGLVRHERLESVERTLPSAWVRMYVWRRDRGKCVQCGDRERVWFDYIIPPWKGGPSTEQNIRLMCARCSRRNRGGRIRRKKLGA